MFEWLGKRFSVITSEEKSVLKLIKSMGEQLNHATDAIPKIFEDYTSKLKAKTDFTGDHMGSWQGIKAPQFSEPGISGVVDKLVTQVSDLYTICKTEDEISNSKTNRIKIPSGNYNFTKEITLKPNTVIEGDGDNTVININTDISVFKTNSSLVDGNSNITIKNMKILENCVSKKKYTFDMLNCFNCSVEKVKITSNEMKTNDVSGVKFSKTSDYTGNHFVNKVLNCQLSNSSIVMFSTDSVIQNNEVWGYPREFAIWQGNSSVDISNNQIVGSKVKGGIFIESCLNPSWHLEGLKIKNNYFDGSYDYIDSGMGIVGKYLRNCNISGNWFWRQMDEGIKIQEIYSSNIKDNVFQENNRRDMLKSDVKIEVSESNNITGNTFTIETPRTNIGYCIDVANSKNDNISYNNFSKTLEKYKQPYLNIAAKTNTNIESNIPNKVVNILKTKNINQLIFTTDKIAPTTNGLLMESGYNCNIQGIRANSKIVGIMINSYDGVTQGNVIAKVEFNGTELTDCNINIGSSTSNKWVNYKEVNGVIDQNGYILVKLFTEGTLNGSKVVVSVFVEEYC